MTTTSFLSAVVFCALIWWALNADIERQLRKSANRPLVPESHFKVIVTELEIVAHRPEGTVERCVIAELREIYIITTSGGPWLSDVWWLFVGSNSGCCFPGGATGEQDALRFAEQLQGFDTAAFISSMSCTSDAKILCWQAAA